MPSLTVENYVKTIYQITAAQQGRPATTGQIATALDVSPGTVTSMLKTLRAPRRINPGTTADLTAAALYVLLESGRLVARADFPAGGPGVSPP